MTIPREHLEDRGISDQKVLRAVREIPREEFVPEKESHFAYDDRPLPIGFGATISQPYIVAAMTELLDVGPQHRVLEVGTGSGYQAAVLSRLAEMVYSIEIVPELAASAAERLRGLGYNNVQVRQGDGYAGWPEAAPFNRIVLTAAPPHIPDALLTQLSVGGKLVSPEGSNEDQYLVVLDKLSDTDVQRRTIFPVLFVPMVPSGSKPGVF